MFGQLISYLRSRQFKNKVYTVGTLSLMTYALYLALTINKPWAVPKRAETAGYDNYD